MTIDSLAMLDQNGYFGEYGGQIIPPPLIEIMNQINDAYVVMPDHLHWLLALQNDYSLSKVMQQVKGSSAFQIQKIRREQGLLGTNESLWQHGYHDHALRKEEDLQKFARYIVANPLKAGIVDKIADYPLWDAVWL